MIFTNGSLESGIKWKIIKFIQMFFSLDFYKFTMQMIFTNGSLVSGIKWKKKKYLNVFSLDFFINSQWKWFL